MLGSPSVVKRRTWNSARNSCCCCGRLSCFRSSAASEVVGRYGPTETVRLNLWRQLLTVGACSGRLCCHLFCVCFVTSYQIRDWSSSVVLSQLFFKNFLLSFVKVRIPLTCVSFFQCVFMCSFLFYPVYVMSVISGFNACLGVFEL